LYMQDTPTAVAFDEAIELARRYGTADSSAFINGVLDRLRREAGIGSEETGAGSQEPKVTDPSLEKS
jgi:transcription antitermination protein NusB